MWIYYTKEGKVVWKGRGCDTTSATLYYRKRLRAGVKRFESVTEPILGAKI